MNHKQWRGWWRNNEYTKKIDDKLKSNMEWSHINNKCNDEKDNDLEPLGEGHSFHSQRNMKKLIQRKEDLRKLTYELSTTNILDKMTLRYQYTHSMMENTMHIHTCAYFYFIFIYLFIYLLLLLLLLFTYIQMHIPWTSTNEPKDDINNG